MTDPAGDLLQRLLQAAAERRSDIPRLMLDDDEVERITGLSRATRHRMTEKNLFPAGTYVAPNRKRWFAADICGLAALS